MDPTVFNVLDIINTVLTTIIGIAFGSQIIYILLFWLKPRKYKEAKEFHRCGIIIAAKDEAEVIGRTIEGLLQLNYPKDKYEIIVAADNCTDNTADIVRSYDGEVKVRVIERHEPDKKKHKVGWVLNYLFDKLMPEIDNFEFFVRFDADDIVDKDYLRHMNNAFESGAKAAKGYNHASNLTQNMVAGVSGLWYIRDSRFNCHARAGLHTDTFLLGGGMMFAASSIKEDGGWICTGTSEDTEFTIRNMDKKRKNMYVPDAILYEDQPSTVKDCFRRNIRMGNGLHKLFWTKGVMCFFKFFRYWRFCYIDMFLNLLFIPIAVLCCTWLPGYYAYRITYYFVTGATGEAFWALELIGILLLCAFVLPFIIQALVVYFLDKKKIGQPFKKLASSIFGFPIFMIIYCAGIVIGVFSRPKWKKAKRNVEFVDTVK